MTDSYEMMKAMDATLRMIISNQATNLQILRSQRDRLQRENNAELEARRKATEERDRLKTRLATYRTRLERLERGCEVWRSKTKRYLIELVGLRRRYKADVHGDVHGVLPPEELEHHIARNKIVMGSAPGDGPVLGNEASAFGDTGITTFGRSGRVVGAKSFDVSDKDAVSSAKAPYVPTPAQERAVALKKAVAASEAYHQRSPKAWRSEVGEPVEEPTFEVGDEVEFEIGESGTPRWSFGLETENPPFTTVKAKVVHCPDDTVTTSHLRPGTTGSLFWGWPTKGHSDASSALSYSPDQWQRPGYLRKVSK